MYLLLTVPESALISSFECRKRLAWKEFEFQIRVTIFCQNVQFSYTFMRASALNIFNIQERPILLVQSLFSLLHSCRLLTLKESLARNGCFFISRVNQSDSSFKTGLTGFNRANVLVSVVFDQSDGVFLAPDSSIEVSSTGRSSCGSAVFVCAFVGVPVHFFLCLERDCR